MYEAKNLSRRNHSKLCVLCGVNPATTRDHLPPEGVFYKPLPAKSNLITVPACDSCNGGSSKSDERFQAFMALHIGHKNSSGTAYYEKQGRTVLHANEVRLAEIRERMCKVELVNPNGVVLGEATAIKWDSEVFESLISRIIKGFYWHHTGDILPFGSRVDVQWPKAPPVEVINLIRDHESRDAGFKKIGDQFAYCFMIDPASPGHSIWVFQFHQTLWASGYTLPLGYVAP